MRINQWWGTQFQTHMNNAKITKPTTPKSTVSTAMYSTACLIFFHYDHYDSCYAAMICHDIILSHPTPARCRTRASLGTWPPHPSAHHALASREWYWVFPSWRAKKSLHLLRTVDHPHHISSCSRHLTPILGIFVLLILLVLVSVWSVCVWPNCPNCAWIPTADLPWPQATRCKGPIIWILKVGENGM